MIFLVAGNFPQMVYPELEKQMKEFIEDRYGSYNRLLSFYYKDSLPGLIEVLKPKETICNFSTEYEYKGGINDNRKG